MVGHFRGGGRHLGETEQELPRDPQRRTVLCPELGNEVMAKPGAARRHGVQQLALRAKPLDQHGRRDARLPCDQRQREP